MDQRGQRAAHVPCGRTGFPSRAAVLMVPRNALAMGLGGGRIAWLAAVQRSFCPPILPRLLCTDCSRLLERCPLAAVVGAKRTESGLELTFGDRICVAVT